LTAGRRSPVRPRALTHTRLGWARGGTRQDYSITIRCSTTCAFLITVEEGLLNTSACAAQVRVCVLERALHRVGLKSSRTDSVRFTSSVRGQRRAVYFSFSWRLDWLTVLCRVMQVGDWVDVELSEKTRRVTGRCEYKAVTNTNYLARDYRYAMAALRVREHATAGARRAGRGSSRGCGRGESTQQLGREERGEASRINSTHKLKDQTLAPAPQMCITRSRHADAHPCLPSAQYDVACAHGAHVPAAVRARDVGAGQPVFLSG
jgi:hypothetical protein